MPQNPTDAMIDEPPLMPSIHPPETILVTRRSFDEHTPPTSPLSSPSNTPRHTPERSPERSPIKALPTSRTRTTTTIPPKKASPAYSRSSPQQGSELNRKNARWVRNEDRRYSPSSSSSSNARSLRKPVSRSAPQQRQSPASSRSLKKATSSGDLPFDEQDVTKDTILLEQRTSPATGKNNESIEVVVSSRDEKRNDSPTGKPTDEDAPLDEKLSPPKMERRPTSRQVGKRTNSSKQNVSKSSSAAISKETPPSFDDKIDDRGRISPGQRNQEQSRSRSSNRNGGADVPLDESPYMQSRDRKTAAHTSSSGTAAHEPWYDQLAKKEESTNRGTTDNSWRNASKSSETQHSKATWTLGDKGQQRAMRRSMSNVKPLDDGPTTVGMEHSERSDGKQSELEETPLGEREQERLSFSSSAAAAKVKPKSLSTNLNSPAATRKADTPANFAHCGLQSNITLESSKFPMMQSMPTSKSRVNSVASSQEKLEEEAPLDEIQGRMLQSSPEASPTNKPGQPNPSAQSQMVTLWKAARKRSLLEKESSPDRSNLRSLTMAASTTSAPLSSCTPALAFFPTRAVKQEELLLPQEPTMQALENKQSNAANQNGSAFGLILEDAAFLSSAAAETLAKAGKVVENMVLGPVDRRQFRKRLVASDLRRSKSCDEISSRKEDDDITEIVSNRKTRRSDSNSSWRPPDFVWTRTRNAVYKRPKKNISAGSAPLRPQITTQDDSVIPTRVSASHWWVEQELTRLGQRNVQHSNPSCEEDLDKDGGEGVVETAEMVLQRHSELIRSVIGEDNRSPIDDLGNLGEYKHINNEDRDTTVRQSPHETDVRADERESPNMDSDEDSSEATPPPPPPLPEPIELIESDDDSTYIYDDDESSASCPLEKGEADPEFAMGRIQEEAAEEIDMRHKDHIVPQTPPRNEPDLKVDIEVPTSVPDAAGSMHIEETITEVSVEDSTVTESGVASASTTSGDIVDETSGEHVVASSTAVGAHGIVTPQYSQSLFEESDYGETNVVEANVIEASNTLSRGACIANASRDEQSSCVPESNQTASSPTVVAALKVDIDNCCKTGDETLNGKRAVDAEKISEENIVPGFDGNVGDLAAPSEPSTVESSQRIVSEETVEVEERKVGPGVVERPSMVRSLDGVRGIPKGDCMLSLLNDGRQAQTEAKGAFQVQAAVTRMRSMRKRLSANDDIRRLSNLSSAPQSSPTKRRSTLPVDVDDIRVVGSANHINQIEGNAIHHLEHDEVEEALELYEEIVHTYADTFLERKGQQAFSEDTIDFRPYVGTSLHNIGILHFLRGDYGEALPFFQRAALNRKLHLGEGHIDYLTSMTKVALCHFALEQFEEAHQELESVVRKSRDCHLNLYDFMQVAEVLNNLGCLSFMWGETDKATKLFEDSLDVQQSVVNQTLYVGTQLSVQETSLKISITRANIGYINLVRKDIPAAIHSFEAALTRQSLVLNDAHDTMVATMDHLAVANLLAGYKEKAVKMLSRIYRAHIEEFGPADERSLCCYQKLQMVKDQEQDFSAAIDLIWRPSATLVMKTPEKIPAVAERKNSSVRRVSVIKKLSSIGRRKADHRDKTVSGSVSVVSAGSDVAGGPLSAKPAS